jgi:hypothetical protein
MQYFKVTYNAPEGCFFRVIRASCEIHAETLVEGFRPDAYNIKAKPVNESRFSN